MNTSFGTHRYRSPFMRSTNLSLDALATLVALVSSAKLPPYLPRLLPCQKSRSVLLASSSNPLLQSCSYPNSALQNPSWSSSLQVLFPYLEQRQG
jgi:hypothetical protein